MFKGITRGVFAVSILSLGTARAQELAQVPVVAQPQQLPGLVQKLPPLTADSALTTESQYAPPNQTPLMRQGQVNWSLFNLVQADLLQVYGVRQWSVTDRGELYGVSSSRIGRSSRPSLGGVSYQRSTVRTREGDVPVVIEQTLEVPDMFVTEGPFVENNLRLDFRSSRGGSSSIENLHDLRAELNYAFNEKFGLIFNVPYASLDRVDEPSASGFGDLEIGARYVFLGAQEGSTFKMAASLFVVTPTGDAARELGEGHTILEPVLAVYQQIGKRSFLQGNLGYEFALERKGEQAIRYSIGIGHVFNGGFGEWFKNPTPIAEFDGFSPTRGDEDATTEAFVTGGLRWQMGTRNFAGLAVRVPLTSERAFDSQFIFSFIHRFGVAAASAPTTAALTSRPTLR